MALAMGKVRVMGWALDLEWVLEWVLAEVVALAWVLEWEQRRLAGRAALRNLSHFH